MRSAKIWPLLQATQQRRYDVFLVMAPLMTPPPASHRKMPLIDASFGGDSPAAASRIAPAWLMMSL